MAEKQEITYYRTVKASEKPKKDGYYTFVRAYNSELTNEPYTDTDQFYFLEGDWFENEEEARGNEHHDPIDLDDFTHYLQPIPMPDAERLRVALEKITYIANDLVGICRKYANDDPYEDSIVDEAWRRILDARLALSAVGDGWIEIKEGCDMPNPGYQVMAFNGFSKQTYLGSYLNGKWVFHGQERGNITHWRPIPPQPINK